MRAVVLQALAILAWSTAFAHGPADWIVGLQNSIGEACCGQNDCGQFVGGEIRALPDGYHVHAVFRGSHPRWSNGVEKTIVFEQHVHEVVPYSQAQPSPDGQYWRCQWGGARKCFFAPPPSI